jgi:hypothetical protein
MNIPRIRPMKLKGRPGVSVRTPFDEVFLAQLKSLVPHGDRWFNGHVKEWFVAEASVDVVTHIVRECFGTVEIVDDDGVSVTHTRAGERLLQEGLF